LYNYNLQISVIIAGKNEKKNIPFLFDSLKKINYPENDFEIIFVDDNSTDDTLLLAKGMLNEFTNLRVIPATNKKYQGKKGALSVGINESRFDYILITDADCITGKEWLYYYTKKFNEGYDFLFGNAPFIKKPGLINKFSRFENLRTFFLYRTALKLHLPYSAAARNFGFRKSSFIKIKGYENTTETLSGDDDLLLREAVKNKMKIGFVEAPGSEVFSFAPDNFRNYLAQKTRHTKTALYYLPVHKIMLALWHLLNLVCLLSFIGGFYNKWLFIPAIIKIISDIIIVKVNGKKPFDKFDLLEIVYLQIIYEFLIMINFINALFKDDKWK
jgi:cellulose synthase/poly-beta-1,6-N-acetylglucosamine synthase-like glycosyltransferase